MFDLPTTTTKTTTIPPVSFSLVTAPIVQTSSSSSINKNETLNEIIKKWQKAVPVQKRIFDEQVIRVATWEKQIRESKKDEQELKNRCDELKIYRDDINGKCMEIKKNQSILEKELNDLDESLSRIIDQEADSMMMLDNGDDYDRERTYAMVEELDLHLQHMENNLKNIIKNFNQTRDSNLNDENANNNPVLKIVQILNIHHNNLCWLESKSTQALNEIKEIKDLSYLL